MLRSAAVAIIQRGAGFRDDLSDECVAALQEAQRLLEMGRSLPRFLKQEDQPLVVASGSGDIALPTGFLREVDGETLHYTDANTTERVYLEKFTNLDRLRRTLDTSDVQPGQPLAYYLRKTTIVILPERNTSYTLTWSYYKADEVLATNVANAWLTNAPDVLIGRAGMILCADIGLSDPAMKERYGNFKQRYEAAWSAMFSDDILREEENYPLFIGSRL